LQSVSPVPQLEAQLLAEQTWLLVQAVPHPPQLAGFEEVSTQTPLHSVVPAGHAQLPLLQVWPPVQTLPQLPQLFGSTVSLLQVPPQSCC
jgi:hypothetical protein